MGALASAALLVPGCTSTVVDVNDYETTCEHNSDCAIVVVGDMCTECPGRDVPEGDAVCESGTCAIQP